MNDTTEQSDSTSIVMGLMAAIGTEALSIAVDLREILEPVSTVITVDSEVTALEKLLASEVRGEFKLIAVLAAVL